MKPSIKMQNSNIILQQPRKYAVLNASYRDRLTWYNKKDWKTLAKNYLKQNTHCIRCHKKGIIEKATIVDHINGHDPEKWKTTFFTGPFQPLCWSCHSKKTVSEDMKNKPKRLSTLERKQLIQQMSYT